MKPADYLASLIQGAETTSMGVQLVELKTLLILMQSEPTRQELQATGSHPAPCARFCEANAFKIEIRNLKADFDRLAEVSLVHLKQLKIALDALDELSRLGNAPHMGNSTGNEIAQRAVVKINELEQGLVKDA